MEIYRVAFIGHREIENYREVEDAVMEKLTHLLREKKFVEFQIGRNGEFDIFVASCIKRLQKSFGNHSSAMTLVLPYPVADMEYFEDYYDSIFIPEEASNVYPKGAITKRNQWLIDNSDLLIAYVRREKGGAATCLKMAEKAKIEVVKI